MNVAISGLRHGHAASIAKHIAENPELKVVAACEEHPEACADYIKAAGVTLTHKDLDSMLKEAEFDILSVGDVFARRGAQTVKGLEAGKHIMADKPVCTRLDEMRRIRSLAESKKRTVLVALTLRYTPTLQTARRLLLDGAIGRVATAAIFGQHPLNFRTGRPDWYFEKGLHGGTITDLMIHGFDAVAWLTGQPVAEVVAARAWHLEPAEAPFFQDNAQAMLRLANDAGVMMEASYKAPKGHAGPWTFHFYGDKGDLYFNSSSPVTIRRHGEPEQVVQPRLEMPGDLISDLVHEVRGDANHRFVLTTSESLTASEATLKAQDAADNGRTNVRV
jgi:predicted dehydrogenase